MTVSVIGKGSYAKVILVKKKSDNKLYAMKVIKKQKNSNDRQRMHVKTERDILVEMKGCPFLIEFYHSF